MVEMFHPQVIIFRCLEEGLHLLEGVKKLVVRYFQAFLTLLLVLLPLHWLLVLIVVWWFSAAWFLAVGAVLFVYPQLSLRRPQPHRSVRRWPAVIRLVEPLVQLIFEYFPMRLWSTSALCDDRTPTILTWDPSNNEQYLFCYHPHGVACFGLFPAVFPSVSGMDKLFPNIRCVVGVANALLSFPILCTILSWWGFVPASRKCCQVAIDQGYSLMLVPGGIAEMLEFDPTGTSEVVFLRNRQGFIKFALKNGLTLVPVYGFGENQTFKRYTSLKWLRVFLSRKLRVTLQLFKGRWGTPIMPFKIPINVVMGKPLRIPRVTKPTKEQVERYHTLYIRELVDLFEKHKRRFGYASSNLVII